MDSNDQEIATWPHTVGFALYALHVGDGSLDLGAHDEFGVRGVRAL